MVLVTFLSRSIFFGSDEGGRRREEIDAVWYAGEQLDEGGCGPNRRKGGDMALTDATPAFCPTEHAKVGMFGMAQGSEFDGYAKFWAIF